MLGLIALPCSATNSKNEWLYQNSIMWVLPPTIVGPSVYSGAVGAQILVGSGAIPMSSAWNSKYFLSSVLHTIASAANQLRLRSLLVLLVALAGLSFTAMAQQATVVGTVTDQSGAA